VFFCGLGHNNEIFLHPAILQHYLDGIQFALGDLKADASPVAEKAERK
jgi:type 1 glutamine amidotransferase